MLWDNDINTQQGSHKVLLKRGEFIDETRFTESGDVRIVPFKIYYPDGLNEKVPVIVWSHGFGGNRDGAAFLSRYVAAHGYVLVHLTHPGTDSSLWEGKPGHPWDILRKTNVPREVTMDRFRDVPFALDQLEIWAKENPDVGAIMDFDTMGMSGHSFGAMTTQVMAGQMIVDEHQELVRMKDERFKSGIVYSPIPIGHLTDESPETLYGPIDIPLLHMTGTDDDSPIEGHGYETRLVVFEKTNHPEKYLLVKQDGDHMVYNGTRGKLEANPNREKHEELVKVVSLGFWDATLKNDTAAKAWLSNEGVAAYISDYAEFKSET